MRSSDLFADALWEYHRRGRTVLYTERESGNRTREDISWYFTNYQGFPSFEKDALKLARGRVLDVGCGAGRHALYLQRRGLDVTGIDKSPRIVDLAKLRGVTDVRVADVCRKLPFPDGEFDTVVLFGNNLGICGTVARVRKMLRELARVTKLNARIIGTTRQPTGIKSKGDGYPRVRSGLRPPGQMRLRLRNRQSLGEWFDLQLLSPDEIWQLADKEGWVMEYLFGQELEQGYAVVLEKTGARRKGTHSS